MTARMITFFTFAGLFTAVVILAALELNGQHTSSEADFLGWGLALSGTGMLLSAAAAWIQDD